MRKAILAAVAILALLACNKVPKGYTAEEWERIQREQPNFAQTIEWIERDGSRSAVREACIYAFRGRVESADRMLLSAAEAEMLHGKEGAYILITREVFGKMISTGQVSSDHIQEWSEAYKRIIEIAGPPESSQKQ